jgi:hypothetical protein
LVPEPGSLPPHLRHLLEELQLQDRQSHR